VSVPIVRTTVPFFTGWLPLKVNVIGPEPLPAAMPNVSRPTRVPPTSIFGSLTSSTTVVLRLTLSVRPTSP
jgi:hypothetical protein